jgi:tetratricopeptide (TPR) repeat protein
VFNRLAQRDGLKLKGRRSIDVVAQSLTSIASIAELLGVQYLLSATVCRDGVDLTLIAELTDHNGFIVWQQEFAEVVNRYDQVEVRLATLVENGVAEHFGDVIPAPGDRAVNRRALEQLLIGQEYLRQGDIETARTSFEEALVIQPDYSEAMLELAWTEAEGITIQNRADSLRRVRPVLDKALVIARVAVQRDPTGFKPNYVLGHILFSLSYVENELAYREFHEIGEEGVAERLADSQRYIADAERHYRNALAANPSASEAREQAVRAMEKQGATRRREALDLLEDGLQLDPFNESLTRVIAFRLDEFGRFREAMERLDRFDLLPDGKPTNLIWTKLEILTNRALTDEKLAELIRILENDPDKFGELGVLYHLWWTVSDIARLGLLDEAEHLYGMVARIPDPQRSGRRRSPEDVEWYRQTFLVDAYLHATWQGGEVSETRAEKVQELSDEEVLKAWQVDVAGTIWALRDTGDLERAISLLEALHHFPYPSGQRPQRQMRYSAMLVEIYMATGREDDAKPVMQRIASHLQSEFDAGVRHPDTLLQLSDAYGWQERVDDALRKLALAIDHGASSLLPCCEDGLTLAPEQPQWWDGLQDRPELSILQSRAQAEVEQRRSNILTLLAQHDMEGLLAPLTRAR